MEAIKKKMMAMKLEKENAFDQLEEIEQKLKEKELEMEKKDEEISDLQKKINQFKQDTNIAKEQLEETNTKLEATEKRAGEDDDSDRKNAFVCTIRRAPPSPGGLGGPSGEVVHRTARERPRGSKRNSRGRGLSKPPIGVPHVIDFSQPASTPPMPVHPVQQRDRGPRTRKNRRARKSGCDESTIRAANQMNKSSANAPIGKRPDPEGAVCCSSETRDIYSCPRLVRYGSHRCGEGLLYSDYGSESDNDESVEAHQHYFSSTGSKYMNQSQYIQCQLSHRCRYSRGDQGRVEVGIAINEAFRAASLNTGTMIRYAIIGAEMQNIVKMAVKKAEGEVADLTRRARLLEDDLELTETRLTEASGKLSDANKTVDESERCRKVFETRSIADEERIGQLEDQLNEAKYIAEDADRKYDEANRKLAITEVDLERAESRLEAAESKALELEDELRVVGNNMKSLEICEQEAAQREGCYEETIRDLTDRLKAAETRAAEAEMLVSQLQTEVDRLEDEHTKEKEKYKAISEELDLTFAELTGY